MNHSRSVFDALALIAVGCMAAIFFSFASAQAARADEDTTIVAIGAFPTGMRSAR